ncbi:hypothetical protein B0H14DRAFT_3082249 [Mycena olivaceomarginata]|nr:hypothetical protein B0H14DRAFT_3082249 [Mycena olivaceomarginata]
MLCVLNPIYKQGSTRWDGFFQREQDGDPIWVSNKNKNYVAGVVQDEAQAVTVSKVLQTAGTAIEESYVMGFSMLKAGEKMGGLVHVATKILNTFATSARNLKSNLPHRAVKRFTVVTPAALALLGEFSHKNNYSRRIMGLYLYATGAQRQTIMVMAHLGISESYQNLTHKPRTNVKRRTRRVSGDDAPPATPPSTPLDTALSTLRELSGSMCSFARVVASTGLFAALYDNINMVFRAAEQILGRNNPQENGTCATIFALWKARLEDMQISDLTAAFEKAPPLALTDILLNAPELETMDKCLRHCILRIIVEHGGEKFKKFRKALDKALPVTADKIELHQTSTIIANTEVADTIYTELEIKGLSHWKWIVKILAGDQLSIARLRSLLNTRAGHEGGYSGFGWGVWMPGLFHGKIADMHGFFVTHWGVPHCGTRNPDSLSFHNTHLHRSPILLSLLPPFRVSGPRSVNLYAELEALAATIQACFANGELVEDLRWQRAMAQISRSENARKALYLSLPLYALILHEFTDAIKAGDSGRIVLVLKILALSFRGNGRSKYAYAMLHLIHNLTHVWPKPIRNIILHNWLVNPTGNLFSWVEVDLMQEHMNFWIKTIYLAHCSAASWEWLGMVAPCVTALRHLSTSITQIVTTGRFTQILGSDQGTKHEPANLSTDINLLMKSLAEHQVYEIKGRVFTEGDGSPTPCVISVGAQQLADSSANPLVEYNAAFRKLQVRLRLRPLVDSWSESESEEVAHAPSGGHADVSGQTEAPQSDADMAPPDDADEQSEPDDSDGSGSNTGSEDDGRTVFERKMDETDEATLMRESAEDVALDMDGDDNDFLFDDLQDLDYFDDY